MYQVLSTMKGMPKQLAIWFFASNLLKNGQAEE
jgi:hypothetical protein